MPRLRWKSSKRRTPRKASRRMSSVHRSPTSSSVRATEHVCPAYVLCSTKRRVALGSCVMRRVRPLDSVAGRMTDGFTWKDGERTIHFGRGRLADAPELLGDDYTLLTTARGR